MKFLTPLTDPAQTDIPTFFELSRRIYGDGNQKTSLIDAPDIGRYTALIIADPRTLNKYVFCYGEEKLQNEIWEIVRKKVGEKIDPVKVSRSDVPNRPI